MQDVNTSFGTAVRLDDGTGTGNLPSTDWIPMLFAQDIASGSNPPEVEIIVVGAAAAGGTSVTPQLLQCDTAGANGVVIATMAAIPLAELVPHGAGSPGIPPAFPARFILRMEPQKVLQASTLKDLRMNYVRTGTFTTSTCALFARLTHAAPTTFGNTKQLATGF